MLSIIDSVRSVKPLADIMVMTPCENGRENSIPMSLYQTEALKVAYEKGCAFLNLQHVFGADYSEYGHDSERAWFASDMIHPDPNTGGRVITDAVMRLVNYL